MSFDSVQKEPQQQQQVPKSASATTQQQPAYKEVLPKAGKLYQEDLPATVLCKPKLLPLKSVTLEKLEKMQKEAEDTVRQQHKEEQMTSADDGAGFFS